MPRRILEGVVVSDKMDKTVTVLVERRTMHPVYKKFLRQSSKYAAHDENNSFKAGDRVQIEECRPISKSKRWMVITPPGPNAGRPPRVKADEGVEKKVKKAKAPKTEAPAAEAAGKEKTEKAAKKAPAKKPAAKKATGKKKDE